ncbi:GEVED domain-containing protein, partial [bacterium]
MDIPKIKFLYLRKQNLFLCLFLFIGWIPSMIHADVDFVGTPRSGPRPLVVTFTDLSDLDPTYTRVWSFPGGTPITATGSPVPVTYTTAGTYTVTLEIWSGGLAGKYVDGLTKRNYIVVHDLIDYGDAPDSTEIGLNYRTKLTNDGASHTINNLYLGSQIDSELDGQQSVAADLDDGTDLDDEDGVTFTDDLIPGTTVNIDVVGHGSGYLNVWVDWGRDGNWAGGADHAIIDLLLADGSNPVSLTIPAEALPGHTYARFRYSPQGGTNWHGNVFNGEVEDYLVYVLEGNMDYGDAPDGYPVTLAEGGARHPISTTYYLGETATDSEEDGTHSPSADWDNTNGDNDETGAAFSILNIGAPASVSVMAHGEGFLNVWIDFNGNGNWSDPGEQVIFGEIMAPLLNNEPFDVPSDATPGITYARVRYSPDQRLGATGVGGPGEVEDYQVEILNYYDFGDAPATFPTYIEDDGAAHPPSELIYLGDNMPDGEGTGQPNVAADGDDDDGYDDEDGVFISGLLPASGDVDIPIEITGRGYLHAWIDFDHSGTWEADEKFIDGVSLSTSVYPAPLTMPPDVIPGHTYARFRYSLDISIGPNGLGAAGEVEDYLINIGTPDEYDYGDAPESYGDPRHPLSETTYIGSVPPDGETGSAYSLNADGDNLAGVDDEEGISFPGAFVAGGVTTIVIRVHGPGSLMMFFDWNQNGNFADIGEGPFNAFVSVTGPVASEIGIPVPISALPGDTYARFRFDYAEGEGARMSHDFSTGEGEPGEVEDYLINIIPVMEWLNEDYGDAPAGYEIGGNAFHTISEDIYMDAIPDPEAGPFSSPDALGDDIHFGDDEDAYLSRIYPGTTYQIEAVPHLAEGMTGYFHAWIDFNRNGDWNDAGEKVVDGLAVPSGTAWISEIRTAPLDAQLGFTFARLRFSTDRSLGPNDPGGDGEIEDYQVRIALEFGDAPGAYLPPGGTPASHTFDGFNQVMYLGTDLDCEFGPFPSLNADGDDLNNFDDENGIILEFLVAGFPAGGIATINRGVITNPTMFLNGWIDFNQNNTWDDLGEHVITDQVVGEGNHPLAINVPPTALPGETCARFRLSMDPGVGTHGFGGIGEVEDYIVTISTFEVDFGDAPDPDYPTYLTHGGAYHMIEEGIYLGEGVDAEHDGQPHAQADGDNLDDGVEFEVDGAPEGFYGIRVYASVDGFINAFADYNGDGDWTDDHEQFMFNWPVLPGPGGNFAALWLPPWTSTDKLYHRIRFTTGLVTERGYFWGGAPNGEVEDYLVDLSGPGALLGRKWTQPPLTSAKSFYDSTYWGWDEKSVYGDTLLADNWFCGDDRPIKVIRWWGSYVDWDSLMPPPEAPESFHVAIWSDDPIDPIRSQSQPGEVIWEKTVSRSETGETVDGHDFYPGITVTPDSVFRYEITLSSAEQFEQQEDSTYFWLSVSAIYADETPEEYVWGWTTRETYLVSDAVQIILPNEPVLGSEFEEGETLEFGWDCAFELLTDLGELPFDFGDAPDPDYPTSITSNGAHHYIWTGTSLGDNLDKEP